MNTLRTKFTEVFLSVIMPAYNEENNIAEAIRRVRAYGALLDRGWELIIVNDGSKDQTADAVRRLLSENPDPRVQFVTSPVNKGKGASVRRGVLASRGQYVLITDADLSSPIKESEKLIRVLEEGYDGAVGSRALREPGGDVQQCFKRRLSGRLFNFFVQTVALRGFLDTQCGFKCFRGEAARKLFEQQTLDGFAFDVEILCLAARSGYKIKEVPVMWRQGKDTRVRLFKDAFAMVRDLFYLRRRYGYP